MSEPDLHRICKLAIDIGASDAKIIKCPDIIIADWTRLKCQYGCPNYNQILTCPPFSPTPEMTRKILSNYNLGLLLQFKSQTPDYKPITYHEITLKMEHTLFLQGFYSVFAFTCGHCQLCKQCNINKCLHPDKARPSMESAGMDVFATVQNAGFDINVLQTKKGLPIYYSLILFR